MARAEETVVTRQWSLECLCTDCELREGGNRQPDFMQFRDARIDARGRAVTPALVSTPDGYSREVPIRGIPRPENVIPAFEQCVGLEIFEDKIVCGAIANLSRGKSNG